jgi:dihydropteroate synthase
VGGESTRPGAQPVAAEEEIRRVVPVVEALRRRHHGFVSIDTTKAAVARAALDAGADLVNDVSGFRFDPAMAPLVAERRVPAVLMHLRGDFAGMHRQPAYGDVAREVAHELGERLRDALRAGVERGQVVLDPGLGFAKDAGHTLELLRRLPELQSLGRPLLVGPSRKSFIGRVLDLPAGERVFGTAAAVAASILAGAHVVRSTTSVRWWRWRGSATRSSRPDARGEGLRVIADSVIAFLRTTEFSWLRRARHPDRRLHHLRAAAAHPRHATRCRWRSAAWCW